MEETGTSSRDVGEHPVALTEAQSKELLKTYGVPVVEEAVARTPEEAAAIAQTFGFPVVPEV